MAWDKFKYSTSPGHGNYSGRISVTMTCNVEKCVEHTDYLQNAIERAFAQMSDIEMLCFIMYYMCGIEQKHIGRALGGVSQQGVSDNLRRVMRKAGAQFEAMRAEVA